MRLRTTNIAAAILLSAVLAVGGIELPAVGTLYILDILVLIGLFGVTSQITTANTLIHFYLLPITIGIAALVLFTGFDIYNNIDSAWLFRGLGTNVITFATFLFGLGILIRYGVGSFIGVFVAMMLSFPVANYVYYEGGAMTAEEFFKFTNGIFLICPILFLFRGHSRVTALVLFACSIAIYIGCDYRSAAAIGSSVSIWLLTMPLLSRTKPWIMGCIALVSIPGATVLSLTVMHSLGESDIRKTIHMDTSDSVRLEMANDAVTKIAARPIFGYGSWQHVLQFVSADPANDAAVEGVHSIPLQLGYDYGLPGLLVAGAIALKLFRVLSRISFYGPYRAWFQNGELPQILFLLAFTLENFLYGALMGVTRFMVGMELALVIWLDRDLRLASSLNFGQADGAPSRTAPNTFEIEEAHGSNDRVRC